MLRRDFVSIAGSKKISAAGFAAAIVLGVQLIQHIATVGLNYSVQGMNVGTTALLPLQFIWVIAAMLPVALGVFLCLWLLAPIAAELRFAQVVGRSLLAVAAGAIVVFGFAVFKSLFSGFDESAGLAFGWAYGAMATASANFGWVATQAMFSAGYTAITVAPLVVLAGVVVWLWVRAASVTVSTPANRDEV